jgi:hypothetical protein
MIPILLKSIKTKMLNIHIGSKLVMRLFSVEHLKTQYEGLLSEPISVNSIHCSHA